MTAFMRFLICLICKVLTHDESIVFEKYGVIFKPYGYVTLDTSNNMVSVFRKAKIPQITSPSNCNNKWALDVNVQLLKYTAETVNTFSKVYTPLQKVSENKHKRQAALVLGLGLGAVDLLLGGIGYGSLKSHLNNVQNELNNFIEQEHEFNEDLIRFQGDIVHVIQKLTSDINSQFAKMSCQIVENTGPILAQLTMLEWKNIMEKKFFKTLFEGKIKINLTPETISPKDLQEIVDNHPMIAKSFYSQNIFMFYQTASITTAQAFLNIDGTITVHQIIHFPMVSRENFLPLFKTKQTGFFANNNFYQLKLPKFVYSKQNVLLPIDDQNCDIRPQKQISTCTLPLTKEQSIKDCVQNFTLCTIEEVNNDTRYVYDRSGLLVTTQKTIQTFMKQSASRNSINIITTTKSKTKFLSWSNISFIQIENILVEKPNFITTNLSVSTQFANETALKISTKNLEIPAIITSKFNNIKSHSSNQNTYILVLYILVALILSYTTFSITKRTVKFLKNRLTESNNTTREPTNAIQEPFIAAKPDTATLEPINTIQVQPFIVQ